MMDKSQRKASIAIAGLSFPDRQNVLRRIVDELQDLCDSAPGGERRPALNSLLHTIRASTGLIAGADEDCWDDIIGELLQLRATMLHLAGPARICH